MVSLSAYCVVSREMRVLVVVRSAGGLRGGTSNHDTLVAEAGAVSSLEQTRSQYGAYGYTVFSILYRPIYSPVQCR